MGCHFLDDITEDCGFSLLDGGLFCYLGLREAGCQRAQFPFSATRGLHSKEHIGP